jgi:hypothetical protein
MAIISRNVDACCSLPWQLLIESPEELEQQALKFKDHEIQRLLRRAGCTARRCVGPD